MTAGRRGGAVQHRGGDGGSAQGVVGVLSVVAVASFGFAQFADALAAGGTRKGGVKRPVADQVGLGAIRHASQDVVAHGGDFG